MVFGLCIAGRAGCGRGGDGAADVGSMWEMGLDAGKVRWGSRVAVGSAAVLVTAACVLEPVAPKATGTTRSKGRGGLRDGAEEIGRGWRALGKLTLNCYQFWTVCH